MSPSSSQATGNKARQDQTKKPTLRDDEAQSKPSAPPPPKTELEQTTGVTPRTSPEMEMEHEDRDLDDTQTEDEGVGRQESLNPNRKAEQVVRKEAHV